MQTDHNIKLTSAEISNLWNTYMNDSLALCTLKYFQEKVQDAEIKPVIKYALELSQKHINYLTKLFHKENHPVPQGFGDEDVDVNAPALFLDTFYLHYIKQMSRIGVGAHGLALSLAARADIRKFYHECLQEAALLDEKVTTIEQSKGLYIRAPYVLSPTKIEFVEKQSFLGHLIGKQRPLLAIEITHLYANIQTNALGKSLVMGFSQAAQSKEVQEFMVRSRDIASKHIEVLGSVMRESHLKVPMTWDDTVTNSTTPPFSDKLMMFHVGAIVAVGIADYGASLAISMRRDLAAHYVRLTAEIGQIAEDGANIMINNGWMEQPPQAEDRDALAEQK
jgi:hypothetical protein